MSILNTHFIPIPLVSFSSVFMLNKCPNVLKVHTYDQVIHLVELYKIGGKLLQKQQERLLNFDIFRHHMSSYCIKPYINRFYTSRAFQGYQEHQNWSSNKEVMQVLKLEENQQTLQHLQQERLLYFDFFRNHMSSYCIKPYMYKFYTSRTFQRYQEHPNRSLYDKVMVLQSWSKNRRLQQRRDVENQCHDVAETEHPDAATLLHDVVTFGVGFGWIVSQF